MTTVELNQIPTTAPLGISQITFEFLAAVQKDLTEGNPIPNNANGNPVISPEKFAILTQLIITGISLNKLEIGVRKWGLKKRIISEMLQTLATAYDHSPDEISKISSFFTEDARKRRHLQAGETRIPNQEMAAQLSHVKKIAAQERKNAKRRQLRTSIKGQTNARVALDTDPLSQYLGILRNIRLTQAEEGELISQASQGNRDARSRLILASLYLAIDVLQPYRNHDKFIDLIGEGNLAIIEAVDSYPTRSNLSFQEYCLQLIQERVSKSLKDPLYALSLDQVSPSNNTPLLDRLEDTSALPEDVVIANAINLELKKLFQAELTPLEQYVLQTRFGLHGNIEFSLLETAKALHISPEEVEEIEREALYKLRSHPELQELLR